ncbi:phosphate ABC transporter substrate-binding protein [Oenococcus sicerae]|uniref:Phosphate-binding protein n=1 Tax=Oenococcus sicerae TaxID=2203724 RepID=A0AAJ1RA77_9LACO|nr:phosphate ABC transporter substrate-binding protein [Oenococcus sicerae]MDN6900963.1 phosphate ABC transporter substrate-binding protein [Oenococcus sicerae]
MRKNLTRIGIILIAVLALYYGSTHRSLTSNVVGSTQAKTKNILIVGSTALQPLAERAGSEYEKINKETSITVQGGGSGAGLTQVQAGSVQIGSSDIFAEQQSGIQAAKLSDHRVAVVGIAPVTNKDVTIKNLSMDQLRKIFTGEVKNWRDLGGPDLAITVVNRSSGSGTRTVFEKSVLAGQTALHAQEQDSNGTVQKIVASTPGSISYLSFGYITGANLNTISIDHVKPTQSNVETNKWKIWGYEHMYTHGKAEGETAKFIKYFQSKKIQSGIVKKLGYIPLAGMQVTKNSQGKVSGK